MAINLAGQPNVAIIFPSRLTVKSFDTVDKGHVEVRILYVVFLLEMPN